MIKGQDIVVLAKLMDKNAGELTYAELGEAARISASEPHSAIRRLQDASLVNGEKRLMKRNVREFLFHALRYFFPLKYAGGVTKGTPTAYSAPVAQGMFSSSGLPPVWSGSDGKVLGAAWSRFIQPHRPPQTPAPPFTMHLRLLTCSAADGFAKGCSPKAKSRRCCHDHCRIRHPDA